MDYTQAMNQCMNGGKKVARTSWNSGKVIETISTIHVSATVNGSSANYCPTQDDMLAVDWEVIE